MTRILGVSHVGLHAKDPSALGAFYRDQIGLPILLDRPGAPVILALGDTTDLFLMAGAETPVDFDIAVDDVDGFHARLVGAGVSCTDLRDDRVSGHRSFSFTDPEGNVVPVRSRHVRPQ